MGRKIGAVVAGVAVLGVVVFALRWAGGLIHPLPPGVDPMNPDDQAAFTAHLATMPFAAWALAWGSEILGAFLGALTASPTLCGSLSGSWSHILSSSWPPRSFSPPSILTKAFK